MDNRAVIQLNNLTKVYGHQAAVDGISLDIFNGEIFGFLGPNGAGKTTTILMLLGLTQPTEGKVHVCGLDPSREPLKVKRMVGYLPENLGFYRDLNASENLRYVARLNSIPDNISAPRIEEALRIVGLYNELDKKVGVYSRGMTQRLGIAELLIKDSKIAFLDEPTLGLDPDGANRIIDLIQSLNRDKNITIIFCSHQLYQVQKICHRVGIIIKGKLVAVGPIERLAKEKLGVGKEEYTLEEIYMKYFQEG